MADQLEQIRQYAVAFLDDGEELVAAMTAAPRGRNTAAAAGGVGSMIGYKMVSGQVDRAKAAGLRIESNMALALTQRRLLTLKVGFSVGGAITGVKEFLSAIALGDVESIEAKRVGLGGLLIITPRGGQAIKLECRVGRAREFVEAFKRTAGRSGAVADAAGLTGGHAERTLAEYRSSQHGHTRTARQAFPSPDGPKRRPAVVAPVPPVRSVP
jgi:hypothetical protein